MEVISGYRCIDSGRSNMCFAGEKSTVRTVYARLTIIASILALILIAVSFYTLLLISPFLLVVYLLLAPSVPFKRNAVVRGVMGFIGWGSFALIAIMGFDIVYSTIALTTQIPYEGWLADTIMYLSASTAVLGTALSVALKPVIAFEVERDPRRYRFSWWIRKRYYFMKLLWRL